MASEQSGWETNVYMKTITRVLVVVGVTYLVRSLYQLWQRMREPRRATNTDSPVSATEEDIGIDLDTSTSFPLDAIASNDVGGDLSLGVNLHPVLCRPPRRYDPRERSPALRIGYEQSIAAVNGDALSATAESSHMRNVDRPDDFGAITT